MSPTWSPTARKKASSPTPETGVTTAGAGMCLPGSKALVSEYNSSVMAFTLLEAGAEGLQLHSFADPAVPAPTSALVADLICAGVRSEHALPGAALAGLGARTNAVIAARAVARKSLSIFSDSEVSQTRMPLVYRDGVCRQQNSGGDPSAIGHVGSGQLLGREPEIRDVRRTQPQNIFERLAHFAEPEIDAKPLEEINQWSRTLGQHRRRKLADRVRISIETVIGDNVDRAAAGTVADDAEKAPRPWLLVWKLGGEI